MPQRPHVHLREPRQRVPRFAGGDHERDPLRQESASDERKSSSRGPVEPLRVVDQTEEGPFLGRFRHEPQDRQSDEERIRGSRRSVRTRRRGHRAEDRASAPSARGSGRTVAGARRTQAPSLPRPHRPSPPEVRPRLDGLLQQRRLADAGVAVYRRKTPPRPARAVSSTRPRASCSRCRPSNPARSGPSIRNDVPLTMPNTVTRVAD